MGGWEIGRCLGPLPRTPYLRPPARDPCPEPSVQDAQDPRLPDGPKFHSFSLSLGVFSLDFGGVFEARDPQMCTFGLSGCRVKPLRPLGHPSGPHPSGPPPPLRAPTPWALTFFGFGPPLPCGPPLGWGVVERNVVAWCGGVVWWVGGCWVGGSGGGGWWVAHPSGQKLAKRRIGQKRIDPKRIAQKRNWPKEGITSPPTSP